MLKSFLTTEKSNTIVVYLKAGIGDLIQLLPVVKLIHFQNKYKIHLFTKELSTRIAKRFDYFDSIITIQDNNASLYNRIASFIHQLLAITKIKYKLFFIPHSGSSITACFFSSFAKTNAIIGFSDSKFKFLFDGIIELNKNISIQKMNNDLLNYLHIKDENTPLEIAFNKSELIYADKIKGFFNEHGVIKIICIYPYTKKVSGGFDKNIEHLLFSELLNKIHTIDKTIGFALIGNISNDKFYSSLLTDLLPEIVCCEIKSENIFDTVSVISICDGVIGIDGGLMHLAQLVSPKCITIWKSTQSEIYGYDSKKNLNLKYSYSKILQSKNVRYTKDEIFELIYNFIAEPKNEI